MNLNVTCSLGVVKIKHQLAQEGGILDLYLSKQNQILAGYEKQAKIAQINATITELDGQKQIQINDILTKGYQLRLDIYQRQVDLQNKSDSNIQRQFKLAEGLAKTDYQKHALAEAAAKQELLNLQKRQEMEQNMLELQIKSNQLALVRQQIELNVSKLKADAALKVAQAEDAKVQANILSTKEDKEASKANVAAKAFELQSKDYEQFFLDQKKDLQNYDSAVQRYNLKEKQTQEKQDKTIAYANTLFSDSGRNAIYQALSNSLEKYLNNNDTRGTGLDNQRYLQQLFALNPNLNNLPTLPNIKVTSDNLPTLNTASNVTNNSATLTLPKLQTNKQETKSNTQEKKVENTNGVNVSLVVNNDIKVQGTDGIAEFEKKLMNSAVLTSQKLYDLIRTTNVELNNN